jgi:hypothetical protein
MTSKASKYRRHHNSEWTKEEDEFILRIVALGERPYNWKEIAERGGELFPLKKRTALEYNRRWQALANMDRSKEPWSVKEELNLIVEHARFKNKWTDISATLRGRSNNTIKNKFYSVFRKVKGKIQKSDYLYGSRLELLEIYYVISVIEEYLGYDKNCAKAKGKRGKDYIWSLIHSIDRKVVNEYKTQLQQLAKHEGTLSSIFAQLTKDSDIEEVPQVDIKIPIEENKNEDINKLPDNTFNIDEYFLKPLNIFEHDTPIPFELDVELSAPLFSPSVLSAGPAATAAKASRAACFTDSISDLSSLIHTSFEERTNSIQHSPDTHPLQHHLVEIDNWPRWIN